MAAPLSVMFNPDGTIEYVPIDGLVAQEAAEEAARARANLSGKALREHLVKSNDELKADQAAYAQKAAKDVGASKETIHTLANIAKNQLHFSQLCYEWNAGNPGVRKTKIKYERLVNSEKPGLTEAMEYCWRNRPYLFEGSLKQACLVRYNVLQKLGEEPNADHKEIRTEVSKLKEAVNILNKKTSDSELERYFPGHGGFRQQQAATEKMRAIERKLGGPMDIAEKHSRFPCLVPGWPDQIGQKKLGFEREIEAREKKQKAADALSPSLMQAQHADQAAGPSEVAEEPNAGGYEGEQAEVFDGMFGDDEVEGVEEDPDEMVQEDEEEDPEPLSPSLAGGGGQNGPEEEDDGAGAIPRSQRVDRRFEQEPPRAPILKRMRTDDYWNDAIAAGGFGQAADAFHSENAEFKKRRTEIDGLAEEQEYGDDGDSEGEQADY